MENRRRSQAAGFAACFLGFFPIFEMVFAGGSVKPPPQPRRTIAVKIVADDTLRKNEVWKVDLFSALRDVSQVFQQVASIKLSIMAYEYWAAGDTSDEAPNLRNPKTLAGVLSAFKGHIKDDGRSGCDITIGLVPEGPDKTVNPGIADYLAGIVLVKYLEHKGGIKYVLLHEICHIFGAVDLKIGGSVMSLRNPGFGIDDFTKAIIRVNRQRSFRPGGCPLSIKGVQTAIGLYKNRQSLGLGEDELTICVGKLQAMMVDLRD